MEKTLILLKPDTLQRGLAGEIISRFERAGLKIVGLKMLRPGRNHYHGHYETIGKMISRHNKIIFERNLRFIMSGPVIAIVLEGVNAIAVVRKMVGDTIEPKSASPGTIRGDYAHINFEQADKADIGIPNLIHASGSKEEAKLEIAHWFKKDELFKYKAAHEYLTQGK